MTSKQNSTSSTLTMLPIKSPTHNNPDQIDWGPSPSSPTPRRLPIDFSPPLIAMVVVVATAFFIVTYFRPISRHLLLPLFLRLKQCRVRWLQWRHRSPSTAGDIESRRSNFFDSSSSNAAYQYFSSHNGLDEEVIKTIPLSVYTKQKSKRDCAVCLVEFEENDYVRTLPVCSHAFHVDCIDIWLNSHANCPLCRTGVFRPESPFIPLMAARIRPSFDTIVLESRAIEPGDTPGTEIVEDPRTEEHRFSNHYHRRDFLLKRSYSFGFERNLGSSLSSDRIVMEAATATPWRYRRGSFWTKRPSPFNSLTKPRVFSFRSYRGGGGGGGGMMKSPFFRRRSSGLFPLSESRRTKSMTSPMFMRSSSRMAPFSSSRLRCGDLEALLSPERLNRRWR